MRRIITAFLVLVVIIAGVIYFSQKNKNKSSLTLPSPTPSITQQVTNKFNGFTIPSDAEKIELKNVSGGEGMGIATRNEVLADLPGIPAGKNYQVFLGNGVKTILLGSMRQAKGGYLLEYDSSKYPGYNQIIVVVGTKHILEGSF